MDCLLVEDEALVAEPLVRGLERAGLRVEWVTSVAGAVAAILRKRPDVALLDVLLRQPGGRPAQSGLDVGRELRRCGHSTPIVVMTGFPTFDNGVAIGRLDVVAVFEKARGLKPIVEACVAAAAAAAAAEAQGPILIARERLNRVDVERVGASDLMSAILLGAVGDPDLTIRQCIAISRELLFLASTQHVDKGRLHDALSTPALYHDQNVNCMLEVLASGPVDRNDALANFLGVSVRTMRKLLKDVVGKGPTEVRCLARAKRFVGKLEDQRMSIEQCADSAGYRYSRQSVGEVRRLFGRAPSEVRRLLELIR